MRARLGDPQVYFVANGSARIEVRAQGHGPIIMVLPSLGRGVEDYDEIAAGLVAEGFRVVRPQPRGIGASTGPLDNASLETLAGDVAAVIEAQNVGPVIVAGHAHGNYVARMLATIRPDTVRGVAILAGSPGWSPTGEDPIDPNVRQSISKAGDASLPEEERIEHLMRAFFAPGNDPRVWLKGWHSETKKLQQLAESRSSTAKFFATGNVPILDLQAECDTIARKNFRHILRQELGDRVTVVEVANAGHALVPEQPDAVVRHLAAWARGLDGRSTCDWIDVGEAVLRYDLSGLGGTPVVLVHDIGGTMECFDFLAPLLANNHRVLRFDQRNCGLSETVFGSLEIGTLSADILGLLDSHGIKQKVIVAGYGVGAAVAAHFAAHYPDRTAALVAMSPTVRLAPERCPAAKQCADGFETQGIRPSLPSWIDVSYPPYMRANSPHFADMRRRWLAANPYGMAAQTRMLAKLDLSDDLARITCPALVLADRADDDSPSESAQSVAEAIAGSRFKALDTAYFQSLYAPEAIFVEIEDFLAACGVNRAVQQDGTRVHCKREQQQVEEE